MNNDREFQPWPKITRENPFKVVITEKLNGTNACVIVEAVQGGPQVVAVQSRRRFIVPGDDNFGFARWVEDNKDELATMGEGHHYGEWVGPGIQSNPHKLDENKFFLFNTARWNPDNPNLPDCCSVVPILYTGKLVPQIVENLLEALQADAIGRMKGETPEGVVVYYPTFGKMTKHTIESPNGKWSKE